MFQLGGSSSSSRSSSQSQSESFGLDVQTSALAQQQLAMQQNLYGQFNPQLDFARQNLAGGLYGTTQGRQNLGQMQTRGMNLGLNAMQRGNQMTGRLQGVGNRAMSGMNQGLWNAQAGMQGLNQFSQSMNPYIQQQISGLAQDFGQLYQEQILPGISGQFSGAGQRGSSRQGIAQALGAQRVGQEFGQAAVDLRSGAYGMQQQAATDFANMGIQQGLGYGQMAGAAYGQGAQMNYGMGQNMLNMSAGLAGDQMNYGLQQQAMGFSPFQIGAGIVGQPSVLNQGFGMDYSQASASSKGKTSSSGLTLGFS